MAMRRPNSKRNLDMAIRRLGSSNEEYVANRTLVANAIVGSLMPYGAVKGGSAMKIRYGDDATQLVPGVLPVVDDAVCWANDLVESIDAAGTI